MPSNRISGILTIQPTEAEYIENEQKWIDFDWETLFVRWIGCKEHAGQYHIHIAFELDFEGDFGSSAKDTFRRKLMRVLPKLHNAEDGKCYGYNISWSKTKDGEKISTFSGAVGYVCKGEPNARPHVVTRSADIEENYYNACRIKYWENKEKNKRENSHVRIMSDKEFFNYCYVIHAKWLVKPGGSTNISNEQLAKALIERALWVRNDLVLRNGVSYINYLRMESLDEFNADMDTRIDNEDDIRAQVEYLNTVTVETVEPSDG